MIIKPYNVDGYFEVTEVFLFQSAGQSTILVLRYYYLCVNSITNHVAMECNMVRPISK